MPRLPASARSGAGCSSLEKHEFAAGEVENGTGGNSGNRVLLVCSFIEHSAPAAAHSL